MAGQICTSYGTQPYFGDFRKMSGKLKYIIFETDMGWVGILASARGLLATTLPQPTAPEARELLGGG